MLSKGMRRRLIPEVIALYEQKKLHAAGCDVIVGLPKDKQLAAAEKCTNGNLTPMRPGRVFKGKGTWRL